MRQGITRIAGLVLLAVSNLALAQMPCQSGTGGLSGTLHVPGFWPPFTPPLGPGPLRGAEPGDFDGVGLVDFVAAYDGVPTIHVFQNQGSGIVTYQPGIPSPASVSDLAVCDVDSDGRPDVVLSGTAASSTPAGILAQGRLVVFLNRTAPGNTLVTFAPPLVFPFGPQGVLASTGKAIRVADLNADGMLDAAMADDLSGKVWVMLGQGAFGLGDGSFGPETGYLASPGLFDLAIADFDLDGVPDVAALSPSSLTLFAGVAGASGLPTGSFVQVGTIAITASTASNLIAADVDHDGIPDLVTGTAGSVLVGHGNGDFTFTFAAHPAGTNPAKVVVGDFTRDGLIDLAVPDPSQSTLNFLVGTPGGSFLPAVPAWMPYISAELYSVGDVTDDGRLDILGGYIGAVLLIGTTCPPPPTPAAVHVLTPNGGEILNTGSIAPIIWSKSATTAAVDLDVSRDGGAIWQRLATGLTTTGHLWPATEPGTGSARIRVSLSGVRSVFDASDGPFAISGPGQAAASPAGAGCNPAGAPPSLLAGSPVLGSDVPVAIAGGPSSAAGAVFISAVPAASTSVGAGCLAHLDLAALTMTASFTTGGSGSWNATIPVPDDHQLVGLAVRAQAVILAPNPAGFVLTNALELTIGF
jgi:FG-GAP-like repeat